MIFRYIANKIGEAKAKKWCDNCDKLAPKFPDIRSWCPMTDDYNYEWTFRVKELIHNHLEAVNSACVRFYSCVLFSMYASICICVWIRVYMQMRMHSYI